MELKGLTGGLYQPLSPADIKTIHQAALAILEKTGISYESGLEDTIKILDIETGKVLKGIEVDPEHLALEVINEVGPGGKLHCLGSHLFPHAHRIFCRKRRCGPKDSG